MEVTPRGVVLVPGTHSALRDDDHNQWWHRNSLFVSFLRSQGLKLADQEAFVWSTDLDGVRWFPWQWFRRESHSDWRAGGFALKRYLQAIPYEDRNVIAHSHGGQVVLYALRYGARIRRVLTVSTPVRKDMRDTLVLARHELERAGGRWRHLYAPDGDHVQWFGSAQIGNLFGIKRTFDGAENCPVLGAGHSRVLNQTAFFERLLVPYGGCSTINFLKGV